MAERDNWKLYLAHLAPCYGAAQAVDALGEAELERVRVAIPVAIAKLAGGAEPGTVLAELVALRATLVALEAPPETMRVAEEATEGWARSSFIRKLS